MRRVLILMMVVTLVMVALMGCGESNDGQKVEAITQSPTPTAKAELMQTMTFSGVGNEATEPFVTTENKWVIDWSYETDSPQYAALGIWVKDSNTGAPKSMVDAGDRPGLIERDSSYVYLPAGEYYLSVLTANLISWEITVKAAE